MFREKVLSVILAGGQGSRMGDLTRTRAKPALSFFGTFRLVDFPLSNLHHSGLSDVWVVEQYRPHSLNDHLRNGRPWDLDRTHGGLMVLPPFQGREDDEDGFARGNAEALSLQTDLIEEFAPDLLLVLSADHIYRADYRDLIESHLQSGADLSVMVWEAPEGRDVSRYSVFETEGEKVTKFHYKPKKAPSRTVGMEVFCCRSELLIKTLRELSQKLDTRLGDYGDHLFPKIAEEHDMRVFRHQGYWRDVGTVESYWEAHMELLKDPEQLPFEQEDWPFLTDLRYRSPARLGSTAQVRQSLLSPGCLVEGEVEECVIGPGVVVERGAKLHSCVVLEGARVTGRAVARNYIVDSGATLDRALPEPKEKVGLYCPDPKSVHDNSRVIS